MSYPASRGIFASGLIGGLLVVVIIAAGYEVHAKSGGGGSGGDAREGRSRKDMVERGVVMSGITPRFPDNMDCPDIASAFASPYRFDGSNRPASRNGGLHGGMDISLDTGTPLLAIADGIVIAKGTGGQALGEYVWMYHPPSATGFAKHIFVKYQHLSEPSPLEVGASVEAGQLVALSGDSGTADRHFPNGYPHLHASVFAADSAEYEVKHTRVEPRDAPRSMDAVTLFLDPQQFARVAADPVALDGTEVPVAGLVTGAPPIPGAKVWPTPCKIK